MNEFLEGEKEKLSPIFDWLVEIGFDPVILAR